MNRIARLQGQLDLCADPRTKTWWESYLKHAIPFRGVKMADIRAVLHRWVQDEGIAGQPGDRQRDLALRDLRPVARHVPRLAQRLVSLTQDDQRLAEVTDVGSRARQVQLAAKAGPLAGQRRVEDAVAEP